MAKKTILFVAALILAVLCTGCDATGYLSRKEEDLLMDFLVAENYIDERAELTTDGVGEGELHNYYCSVSSGGNECTLNIQQSVLKEDYRVFSVSITDGDEEVIHSFDVSVDRKTGAVSLYEK